MREREREEPKQREGDCLIGLALSAVIAVCDSFAISLPSTLRSRLRIRGERPRLFPRLPLFLVARASFGKFFVRPSQLRVASHVGFSPIFFGGLNFLSVAIVKGAGNARAAAAAALSSLSPVAVRAPVRSPFLVISYANDLQAQ